MYICSPGENNKVQMRQCNNPCNRERCGRRNLVINKDGPRLTRETTRGIAVTALFVHIYYSLKPSGNNKSLKRHTLNGWPIAGLSTCVCAVDNPVVISYIH